MNKNPPRQLKVNLAEVAEAMNTGPAGAFNYYLDLETGIIELVTAETRERLEEILEEATGVFETDEEIDLPALLAEASLPEWEKESLLLADRIDCGFGVRYLRIPTQDSHQGWEDMRAFIDTLQNPRLRSQLERALAGRGPFRNFKNVIGGFPHEEARWLDFRGARQLERAREWLAREGIEVLQD